MTVSGLTVMLSVAAGFGFRRRFPGSGVLFYLAVASLVMPSLFVGFGIALGFKELGWKEKEERLSEKKECLKAKRASEEEC